MSVRFFNDNFADPDVASNITKSSEQASFPVNNLFNKERRSKVWRTDGYWFIESGKNTIVFNEGGSDLEATVTAKEYNSTSSFVSAVESAFDSAGSDNYTVTQNSDNKFEITNATGNNFTIKWTDSKSADMADILGFSTDSDDSGNTTYTADQLRIHTSEWVQFDFGITTRPEAVILIGPRNAPIKISPTATIKLLGNETDVWTDPTFSKTITYDDEVMIEVDTSGFHTEGLRYWRLEIVDQNPLGYVELGAFFLGDFYTTTRGAAQFPFSSNLVDRTETTLSEGGQSFSDVREKTQGFNLTFSILNTTEVEKLISIFETFGTGTPLFIQYDSNVAFSSDKNYYTRYVKFQSPPSYELVSPNNFSMNMSFLEQL